MLRDRNGLITKELGTEMSEDREVSGSKTVGPKWRNQKFLLLKHPKYLYTIKTTRIPLYNHLMKSNYFRLDKWK